MFHNGGIFKFFFRHKCVSVLESNLYIFSNAAADCLWVSILNDNDGHCLCKMCGLCNLTISLIGSRTSTLTDNARDGILIEH